MLIKRHMPSMTTATKFAIGDVVVHKSMPFQPLVVVGIDESTTPTPHYHVELMMHQNKDGNQTLITLTANLSEVVLMKQQPTHFGASLAGTPT